MSFLSHGVWYMGMGLERPMLSFMSHGVLDLRVDFEGCVLSFWSHDFLDLGTDFNRSASLCCDYSLQDDFFRMFCAVCSFL